MLGWLLHHRLLFDDPLDREGRAIFIEIEVVERLLREESGQDVRELNEGIAELWVHCHLLDLSEDFEYL